MVTVEAKPATPFEACGMRIMKTTALLVLGCATLAVLPLAVQPARADVFSSQGFSGGTTTLDNLPGVNLDAVPGYVTGKSNCAETELPSFGARSPMGGERGTTCRFGNFSITTTGSGPTARPRHDLIYGGNPPPWVPNWQP